MYTKNVAELEKYKEQFIKPVWSAPIGYDNDNTTVEDCNVAEEILTQWLGSITKNKLSIALDGMNLLIPLSNFISPQDYTNKCKVNRGYDADSTKMNLNDVLLYGGGHVAKFADLFLRVNGVDPATLFIPSDRQSEIIAKDNKVREAFNGRTRGLDPEKLRRGSWFPYVYVYGSTDQDTTVSLEEIFENRHKYHLRHRNIITGESFDPGPDYYKNGMLILNQQ